MVVQLDVHVKAVATLACGKLGKRKEGEVLALPSMCEERLKRLTVWWANGCHSASVLCPVAVERSGECGKY